MWARCSSRPEAGARTPMFGDLDGDGRLDVVFRSNNGIAENTRDPGSRWSWRHSRRMGNSFGGGR